MIWEEVYIKNKNAHIVIGVIVKKKQDVKINVADVKFIKNM